MRVNERLLDFYLGRGKRIKSSERVMYFELIVILVCGFNRCPPKAVLILVK